MLAKHLPKPVMWRSDSPIMLGKTVIVTGANSGIGLETSAELARYGARVILACRDPQKAKDAKKSILEKLQGGAQQAGLESRLVLKQLNLASFKSIRSFVDEVAKSEKRLDVLINNAGCDGTTKLSFTEDGLETTMATNHFGPFLLTNLLLPLLKNSAPARVVIVSGEGGHKLGKIEFDNLNSEKSYRPITPLGLTTAYCNSKLANILFAKQLAVRLQGSGVTVTACQPGIVSTGLCRNTSALYRLKFALTKPLLRTPLQGAQTVIYLAAADSPDAKVNGGYYRDCKIFNLGPHATDLAVAKQLWDVSTKLTKLS